MLSQATVLFDNLLTRTAKEEPKIRELFQDSGLEDLTDIIIVTDARHVATGGYSDVFETGLLRSHSEEPKKVEFLFLSIEGRNEVIPSKVAVKVLRINQGVLDAEDGKKLSQIRTVTQFFSISSIEIIS